MAITWQVSSGGADAAAGARRSWRRFNVTPMGDVMLVSVIIFRHGVGALLTSACRSTCPDPGQSCEQDKRRCTVRSTSAAKVFINDTEVRWPT